FAQSEAAGDLAINLLARRETFDAVGGGADKMPHLLNDAVDVNGQRYATVNDDCKPDLTFYRHKYSAAETLLGLREQFDVIAPGARRNTSNPRPPPGAADFAAAN